MKWCVTQENEDCVLNECLACQGGILFDRNIADPAVSSMDEPLQWLQWSKEEDQTVAKKLVEGTVENALDDLKGQLPRFLWHNLLKEKQSAAYEEDKIRSGGQAKTNCMVQMDFAENYTCVYQDEVQSAHWRQTQVTIFTVMIYLCGSHPLVIVTDCRDHDKRAVTAFLVRILKKVSEEFSHITDVGIWTDGPSSQFKNKFMFACLWKLQQKFNKMNLRWNFTATSHGKGPNDALGGTVKRMVHRRVMSRQNIVSNADTFVKALKEAGTNIGVLLMSPDDIVKECDDLGVDDVWKNLPVFKGTINTHLVEVTNDGLTRRWYRNHVQTLRDVGPYGQVTAADEPDQAPNINTPGKFQLHILDIFNHYCRLYIQYDRIMIKNIITCISFFYDQHLPIKRISDRSLLPMNLTKLPTSIRLVSSNCT